MAAVTTPDTPSPPAAERITRSGLAWAVYEGGRIPYMQMITGSVFVPYFATIVIGDAVEGQAQVAALGKWAGLLAAFTAPLLGASIDRLGARKPWIAGGTAFMVVLLTLLWWTLPGGAGLPIWAVMTALILIKVVFGYTEVLHNSLLVRASDGGDVSRLSAISLAIGSGFGMVVLSLVLWGFALPGRVHWAFVPAHPLFGLDPATYEQVRISAPIAAGLMALMTLPLLLLSRDYPRRTESMFSAFAGGLRYLAALPTHLKGRRDAGLFLLARMIYADGASAIVLFGGVYAAGVMKWGAMQLLVVGILRMACAALGAFFGAALDRRIGGKASVQFILVLMIVMVTAMIGVTPSRMLYVFGYDPAIDGRAWAGMFGTPPELLFLALTCGVAFAGVALSTSSRYLLTALTPASETGAFFGLYALATAATSWLAPQFVELFTRGFGSQQAGIAPIIGFFVVGVAILSLVRAKAISA
jgi:UMF1 family MFS transporter